MSKKNKNVLKRYAYVYLSFYSIMISSEIQAINKFSEDEIDQPINAGYIPVSQIGRNVTEKQKDKILIGQKSFIVAKHPKYDWEGKNLQNSLRKDKANPVDYFSKIHPELLDQASKSLSNYKNSFITKIDDNGNPEYDDKR